MKKRENLGLPPSTLFVLSRVSFLFWSPCFYCLVCLFLFCPVFFFFPRSFFLCPGSLDVGLSFSLRAVDEGPPMFFRGGHHAAMRVLKDICAALSDEVKWTSGGNPPCCCLRVVSTSPTVDPPPTIIRQIHALQSKGLDPIVDKRAVVLLICCQRRGQKSQEDDTI